MHSPSISTPVDEYVFLLGRPPVSEYLNFVRTMVLDGHTIDQARLTEQWRRANQHLRRLEATEAGSADNAPLIDLPAEVVPFANRVTADPVFRASYSSVSTKLAMVSLDQLVVTQKFINRGFVKLLTASLPKTPSPSDVARVAFGLDRPQPPIIIRQAGGSGYQFVSPSNDLRLLESDLLSPSLVSSFKTTGRPYAFVVMAVGFGSNYLNAFQVEGRLVLSNGSHRAYTLRALGVTHVPCVVQQVSTRDELELVATGEFVQNPDRYLKAPRPAMLRDYFDNELVQLFPVPRKARMVQVQIAGAPSDIPCD